MGKYDIKYLHLKWGQHWGREVDDKEVKSLLATVIIEELIFCFATTLSKGLFFNSIKNIFNIFYFTFLSPVPKIIDNKNNNVLLKDVEFS